MCRVPVNETNMLRKIRVALAVIFFACITLLFLDFTGTIHAWFGWMAKIQFLPAVLALNFGVVAFLVLLTLVCGRVYCSVICPMGVMQDLIAWLNSRRKKKRYRYGYSPAKSAVRYGVLAVFVAAMAAGAGSLVALLAPYSSYGRIAANLFAPLYRWGNNLLACFAERANSYAFYETEVWLKSMPVLVIAVVTFVVVFVLALRNGRTYCNVICPVGTVLGFLSKYSLFKIKIDAEKCNSCGLCSRRCKAACINGKAHTVDYSRCVMCFDCIDTCKHHAISYEWRYGKQAAETTDAVTDTPNTATETSAKAEAEKHIVVDEGRRAFLAGTALAAGTLAVQAQEKKVDGGLAVILDKEIPNRSTRIVPPGAVSLDHLAKHCTGCQLCVQACPNGVLRPQSGLLTLMQPESSYERGYCRPECTRCSEVCPAGAIHTITPAEKSSIQIGHAVWVKKNCLPLTEGVECGNCARHCPAGAIQMVPSVAEDPESVKVPVVNAERCIGCGACENLCPARPFSAIYVEGHENHRII